VLAREKGMLLVIERMKKFGAGLPIVFTGDHNCREDEAPARAVAGILKDALYVSETPPEGSWRTFSGWEWLDRETDIAAALEAPVAVRNARKGSPDGEKRSGGRHPYERYGARIDYVYVSDGVRVLDFRTVNDPRPGTKLYPSDHFPVVATIEL
jgi:endonuclease/exonuclease/phosphatase family metal-dependent hydrolase